MVNKKLVDFIKEGRRRGFADHELKKLLFDNNWPVQEVNDVFEFLRLSIPSKNQLCISLDDNVLKIIEKRAKRNLLSLEEQVEDIVRRSAVNLQKPSPKPEKLDDMLVGLFSRRQRKK